MNEQEKGEELTLRVYGPFFPEDIYVRDGGGERCQGCGQVVATVVGCAATPLLGDIFACSGCGAEHQLREDGFCKVQR